MPTELERGREGLSVPGLESPQEIIQLGSVLAIQDSVRRIGNGSWEIARRVGAYGGNLYEVRHQSVGDGFMQSLELTGGDLALTIHGGSLLVGTKVYLDYYHGQRNVRDILSGMDPVNGSPNVEVEEEEETSKKPKLIPLGQGFYTRRSDSTPIVVAKGIDEARDVYVRLFEMSRSFGAMRDFFSEPNRNIVYMTPERYEKILSPEQREELFKKLIKGLLGSLYSEDDTEA